MTHIELISSGCTANTIKFEDPIIVVLPNCDHNVTDSM